MQKNNKNQSQPIRLVSGQEMKIEYQPIGIVHSPFKSLENIPNQSFNAKDIERSVEIYPEFQEGLNGLKDFPHLILLCHFHQSKGYKLMVYPYGKNHLRGLFSTRSPRRPNPIGLSVVRIKGIEGHNIMIMDLDILDGTPVLDIKPYFPTQPYEK